MINNKNTKIKKLLRKEITVLGPLQRKTEKRMRKR